MRKTATLSIAMNAHDIVKDISRLVSLPEVCSRLHEMLDNPRHSVPDIAQLISQDTDLAARLLKLANSSLYGFSGRIDNLSRAVNIVGTSELLVLIIATSSVMTFNKIPGDLFNMASFWRHSVYSAVVARQLAKRCNVLHPERLFIAGLLHDIGQLALCYNHAKLGKSILEAVQQSGQPVHIVEQEQLGFDHADTGAALLKLWGLPKTLQLAIAGHHQLHRAGENAHDAAIIHIASAFTHVAEDSDDGYLESIDPLAWRLTGLDKSIIDDILQTAGPEFDEMLNIIVPSAYK